MRTIVRTAAVLSVLMAATSTILASCSGAVNSELFVHQSPGFTLTVPKWTDQKNKKPDVVLKRLSGSGPLPEILVVVSDLRAGTTYQDAVSGFQKGLEHQLGSAVEVLYGRDLTLKDGTPAYEIELRWKYGMWPAHSYIVIVFKDQKSIWVGVSDKLWIGDGLKQYPLSLKLK
ncbi:MAG: hypothetical protein EG826_16575 [Deltaproteobacteria bacterium]|nr:hypothetical protein [Deltaproteobacteria bacterium]